MELVIYRALRISSGSVEGQVGQLGQGSMTAAPRMEGKVKMLTHHDRSTHPPHVYQPFETSSSYQRGEIASEVMG